MQHICYCDSTADVNIATIHNMKIWRYKICRYQLLLIEPVLCTVISCDGEHAEDGCEYVVGHHHGPVGGRGGSGE